MISAINQTEFTETAMTDGGDTNDSNLLVGRILSSRRRSCDLLTHLNSIQSIIRVY